jgi:hypothetical protein
MSILLLIPGCISLFLVLRGRIETAFLSVYLPSLLLLPVDYGVRIPHLPQFSAAEFALIPIGVVALQRHVQSGSFRLMDALVFLFWVSWSASEIVGEPVMNDGILNAVSAVVPYLMAYATGRRLIEPNLRLETVRRFVIFILLLGPIGLYEWRFLQSPYAIFGQKILGIASTSSYNGIQMRGGRGRFSASLGGGEIAGLIIAMTFALNAWLVFLNRVRTKVDLGKRFARLEKYHIPGLLLVIYIWMTQSRGPMIGLAAGYPILQIPRFKNTKLGIGLVAVVLGLGALGAYQYFSRYTTVKDPSNVTEEQASAIYRREMLIVYQSVADMGGWLGWSMGAAPHLEGKNSIDNHFLLVHLIQGEFGYILFILIAAESVRTGVARVWSLQALEDRAFACSVLAAFVTLWITLYTVFMGGQVPQITFILLGWGQSIVPARTAMASVAEIQTGSKFSFRKVLT